MLSYFWISILFFIITTIISIIGAYFGLKAKFVAFRHIWGSTHNFLQNLFILQLYKLRNNDASKFDMVVDNLFLVICGYDNLIRDNLVKLLKMNFLNRILVRYSFVFWGFLIRCIVIIFIFRQLYLFIKYKKLYPFKIFLLASVFIVYYYTLIMTRNTYAAF
ncbi:MAG: hypothetical protein N2Z79_04465, partial [Candidatus Omnitrophica bacterium]|nr:hypothetical protein [Candidatus Omnitrophota bacterium]